MPRLRLKTLLKTLFKEAKIMNLSGGNRPDEGLVNMAEQLQQLVEGI
jgi:hypothetical protein